VGIYPGSRIEVINGYLLIGKNTRIGQNFFCETSGGRVVIGENVTISANCFLGTTNYNWRKMPDIGFKASEIEGGEIVIEDNVFIGFGACILPGAHLGKGSIVGALSVVNSYVPAGTIFKTRRL
jgi:acetyltransferase-like isoleucine patch superfamily enzyme